MNEKKPNGALYNRVAKLEEHINNPSLAINEVDSYRNLERCIAKMAHFSGNEKILAEFGIKQWTPGKKDMVKYK